MPERPAFQGWTKSKKNKGFQFVINRYHSKFKLYRERMDILRLAASEFSQLNCGYMGGFTHANNYWTKYCLKYGKSIKNVVAYDFKSSYPAVMVSEKYPMSAPNYLDHEIDRQEFDYLIHNKCCLFVMHIYDLVPKSGMTHEHPISKSKCIKFEGVIDNPNVTSPLDNGRVVAAKYLEIVVTELDYITYNNFYDWDHDKSYITNMIWFEKQYLPKNFIMAVLKLFNDKTILDGDPDMKIAYAIAKAMLNALYGMAVTNPVRDQFEYSHDMVKVIKPNNDEIEDIINKYNDSKNRFLYYPWGVWVTAYARRNLFTAIEELKEDYIYSDTDSVYLLDNGKHDKYFEDYNNSVITKLKESAEYNKIPLDLYMPKNLKGETKIMGIWELDGKYDEFSTLGAKRYITRSGDKYKSTIAGASKTKVIPYLRNYDLYHDIRNEGYDIVKLVQENDDYYYICVNDKDETMKVKLDNKSDPFSHFTDSMELPEIHSGRVTFTYIDYETEGHHIDYLGVNFYFHELSSVHSEPSKYNLTLAEDYISHLLNIQEIRPN